MCDGHSLQLSGQLPNFAVGGQGGSFHCHLRTGSENGLLPPTETPLIFKRRHIWCNHKWLLGVGLQLTGCNQSTPFILGRCFGQQQGLGEHVRWQGSLSLMVPLSFFHVRRCLVVPWILCLLMPVLFMSRSAVITLCSCR